MCSLDIFSRCYEVVEDGCHYYVIFFFKQKTAYEMRISDWSSDVCSSDLASISRFSAGTLASAMRRASRSDLVARTPVLPLSGPSDAGSVARDRKSVVEGKSVSVRVDLGGRRNIKLKNRHKFMSTMLM